MQSNDIVADVLNQAQAIEAQASTILNKAPLTSQQREDFQAIQVAAQIFQTIVNHESATIRQAPSAEDAQRVRHDLRNHLNIMIGFTQLIVRELPDNLLLHMGAIRDIYSTAQALRQRVDSIE